MIQVINVILCSLFIILQLNSWGLSLTTFYILADLQCGRTKKIVTNITITTNLTSFNNTGPIDNYNIQCTEKSSCYCSGSLCIKGGYCNAGIAFWLGKPICGQNWGEKYRDSYPKLSTEDELFCKQLGFRTILRKNRGYNGR